MPIQPTQADLDDYERRMELMRQKKPVYWGPDANAYSYERHVREEQEAQRRREIEVMERELAKRLELQEPSSQNLLGRYGESSGVVGRENLPKRIGPDVPGQQERHAENLSQFDGQPAEQSGNAGLMSVPSGPAPSARERYERMSPYDKWIHRMKYGEPGVVPQTNPSGMKVEFDLPGPLRSLQEPLNPPPDRIDQGVEFIKRNKFNPDDLPARHESQNTMMMFAEQEREADLARWEQEKTAQQKFMKEAEAARQRVIAGRREPEHGQPSRLRAMQNRDPVFEALVGQRDRLRNETRVDGNGDSDVTRRFQQSMADQPEPTWKSPEEKMEDTHTAMQRALSGRNTEAREARRGYRPPSEDFSNERIAQGLRQRLTGQVDELSNADGRLGAMQAANDRTRAKEQDDLAANLAGFRQMRAMLDARGEEAKEAGLPNPTGTPIGGRRVKRTGDGERGDMSVGLMRRLAVREREQARSNAVNEARTAAQTGKDYEYKPTGNAANDRYAQAAASNVNSREVTRQAMLRDQMLARDDATGGRLGIRKAMQSQAAEEQRLKNSLLAQEKANEFVSAQNELDRQNELEKARIAAGARGGNEPNVTAIRSAMDAASVTLMKPDAKPDEVAEAKRIISEGQRALNGAAGIPNGPTIRPKTVEEEQAEASQNNARTKVIKSKTPDVAAWNALQALDRGTLTEAQAFAEAGKYGPQAVQHLRELLDDRRNITDVRSAVGGMY